MRRDPFRMGNAYFLECVAVKGEATPSIINLHLQIDFTQVSIPS